MLELSALGLLQRQPLHGYRLKQQLEIFMGSCMSVNYGAIYPLLKRLEEQGYISASEEEISDAGPCRKTYRITPKGRQRWREKMLEHPQESWVKTRSRFTIKFFFFNDLEPIERINLIEHRLMVCRLRQEFMQTQEQEHIPTNPYQAMVWERAIEILLSEMAWLTQQLMKERANLAGNLQTLSSASQEELTPSS